MITVIGRVSVLGGIVNVTMAQRVAIELSVGGILPTMTTVTFTHRTDVYITHNDPRYIYPSDRSVSVLIVKQKLTVAASELPRF